MAGKVSNQAIAGPQQLWLFCPHAPSHSSGIARDPSRAATSRRTLPMSARTGRAPAGKAGIERAGSQAGNPSPADPSPADPSPALGKATWRQVGIRLGESLAIASLIAAFLFVACVAT